MIAVNNGKQFNTVRELRMLLSEFFENTPVYVGGCNGYFHVVTDDKGRECIMLDDKEVV